MDGQDGAVREVSRGGGQRGQAEEAAWQDGHPREAAHVQVAPVPPERAPDGGSQVSRLRERYADEERDPLKLRLRCLVVATDQESLQLAGCNFLKHHSKVAMLRVYDPMHRRQNDSVLAMGESGALRRCSMNLSLYNLKFGPWLKGGWYRMLQETGEQLRDTSPNDPLLLLFWPDILKDRNFVLEDSQSGREDFLKTLRSQHFLTSKGPKASLSKFNALSETHRLLDEHWSSQCFVMTATCLLQGWVSYADQLWCPDDCVAALMQGASTKAEAKASAKAALEKMRGKAVDSLRSVTKYMNDPEVKCQSRLIA